MLRLRHRHLYLLRLDFINALRPPNCHHHLLPVNLCNSIFRNQLKHLNPIPLLLTVDGDVVVIIEIMILSILLRTAAMLRPQKLLLSHVLAIAAVIVAIPSLEENAMLPKLELPNLDETHHPLPPQIQRWIYPLDSISRGGRFPRGETIRWLIA